MNLSLCLQGRRDDGYHELETVMLALRFYDELQLEAAEDGVLELTVSGADDVPTDERNLVIRAERLRTATGCSRGGKVRLTKRIPSQAGLGGGSSDAAAALVAGNRLWALGLSADQLSTIAATLGSDVPFFLAPRAAVCTGRGEQVRAFYAGAKFADCGRQTGRRSGHFFRLCELFCPSPRPITENRSGIGRDRSSSLSRNDE